MGLSKRGDGKQGGLLKTVSAQNLGGLAIQGALEKTNTDPNSVDHVVMGYALQTCSQSIYGNDMQVFKVNPQRFLCSRSREFAVQVFNQL